MAVRVSKLGLSFSVKKRLNPISFPIPPPLTMGTAGPLGQDFPAEKDFTVFVYLPQTVCLAVYERLFPHPLARGVFSCRVLLAAHSHMPFIDTHHPVIKMPAGSIRRMFVRSVLEFPSCLSSS